MSSRLYHTVHEIRERINRRVGSVRMTAEWRAVWSEWAWLTKTHSLDLTGIFGSIQIPNRGK